MDKKNIYRAVIFLIIGVVLLWFVFKGTALSDLKHEMYRINVYWIGVSILLNIFSQLIRAMRWRMLFKPIGYKPRTGNLFLSILILAFTNQIIPRGGEIARLGVVNRYEKVPFAKLFGVAMVERLTDLAILLLVFIGIVVWQLPFLLRIIELPEITFQNVGYLRMILWGGAVIVFFIILFFILRRYNFFVKLQKRFKEIKKDIFQGFTTIYYIEKKAHYILMSFLLYFIWLLMLYVLFFAYPPTSSLGIQSATLTFGLATTAFLLPIQSGMGAWHFLVIQSLLLFGVGEESGKIFALMAHATTNLVYLPLGAIAFALLPVLNRNNGSKKR